MTLCSTSLVHTNNKRCDTVINSINISLVIHTSSIFMPQWWIATQRLGTGPVVVLRSRSTKWASKVATYSFPANCYSTYCLLYTVVISNTVSCGTSGWQQATAQVTGLHFLRVNMPGYQSGTHQSPVWLQGRHYGGNLLQLRRRLWIWEQEHTASSDRRQVKQQMSERKWGISSSKSGVPSQIFFIFYP